MDIIFLVGRIILGGFFLMNGIRHFTDTEMITGYGRSRGMTGGKGMVLLSGLVLIAGVLGIILGVYTGIAITLLALFLLAVSFQIHHFWTDQDPQKRMGEMQNFAKNMALFGALLMLYMVTIWPMTL